MNKKGQPDNSRPSSGSGSRGRLLIALAVLAVLAVMLGAFLLPWLFDFYTDGYSIHQSSREALVRNILWEDPVRLDGGINESPENYEPTFSSDGLTMIFTRGKARHNADLLAARWNGQGFGEPAPIESINSPADELGPELSRDGRYLYFYSDRPGGLGGYDIWISRWNGKEWTGPENAGGSVNTGFNEYGPGLTPDGARLFFSSNRLRRELTEEEKEAWHATLRENFFSSDYDIYSAPILNFSPAGTGAPPPPLPEFEKAERVARLNSPADEGQVAMTPRGDFIYFSSNREDGLGGFDLFRSRIFHGEFLEPENMGAPVNSPLDDMDPALILEGHGLVFSSNRLKSDDQRPFLIYRTVSREVIVRKDWSGLAALLRLLDRLKWPLLFLILGLLALLLLLRYLASRRFRMQASLLQRCLLASLLMHLLLALLLSTWMVGSSLYDLAGESTGEMRLDMDALAQDRLGLEIREQVTDLEAARDDELLGEAEDTLASLTVEEPDPLLERSFEPDELAAAFAPDVPDHRPVPERLDAPERLSWNEALANLEIEKPDDSLEVPAPAASAVEPGIPGMADGPAVARAAVSEDRVRAVDGLPPAPTPADAPRIHDSLATMSEPDALQRAPRETLPPAMPPLEVNDLPRAGEEDESVRIVLEIPEPRPEAARPEPAPISGPEAAKKAESAPPSFEDSPRLEASTAPYIREDRGAYRFAPIATAKIELRAEGREELAPPKPSANQNHELTEEDVEIVMEVPARRSGPESKTLETLVDPEPSGRIDPAASVERATPLAAGPPVPVIESRQDAAHRRSFLKEVESESNPLASVDPVPRRPRASPLADRRDPPASRIVLEGPAAPVKGATREIPPLSAPGAMSRQEPVGIVAAPDRIRPEGILEAREPARMSRDSAVKETRHSPLPHQEPGLSKPRLEPRDSIPPVELSADRRLEIPSKPSPGEAAPDRKIESLSASSMSRPVALERKSEPVKMVPVAPPRPDLEKPPPATADLHFPVTVRVKEPEIDRFEHEAPRTYHGLEMRSRRVVFCLDVSRSMEWNNRIGEARQELLRLLDTLDETLEFNIITFSGSVRVWNRYGVQPGTAENVRSAKRFVQGARIASDGTNTVGALAMALADEDVESVYFLSDGHPTVGFTTNTAEILRHVRELQADRGVVIHTIAYIKGEPPRSWRNDVPPKDELIQLMRRLAEENGGNFVVFDE